MPQYDIYISYIVCQGVYVVLSLELVLICSEKHVEGTLPRSRSTSSNNLHIFYPLYSVNLSDENLL